MHRLAAIAFAAVALCFAPCVALAQDEEKKKPTAQEAALAVGEVLHDILLPTMTNPQVADAMANATYEGYETEKPNEGRVQVSMTVTMPIEGMVPTKQFFWSKKVDGKYRIVDMANGAAEKALSIALGGQYEQHSKTLTPLDYVRLMQQG